MNRAATTRRNAEPRPIAEIVQEIYKRIIRTPRTRKNRQPAERGRQMKRQPAPPAKPSAIKALAEKCGIPENEIARAMRRESVPLATAEAIARELNIPAAEIPEQPAPPITCQLTAADVKSMLETILANRGAGYSPIIIFNCGSNSGVICGINNGNAGETVTEDNREENAQTVHADHNARADIIGAHNTAEGGARLQSDDTTANIPRAQIAGNDSRQMQSE